MERGRWRTIDSKQESHVIPTSMEKSLSKSIGLKQESHIIPTSMERSPSKSIGLNFESSVLNSAKSSGSPTPPEIVRKLSGRTHDEKAILKEPQPAGMGVVALLLVLP
jgi:hypothetical protein